MYNLEYQVSDMRNINVDLNHDELFKNNKPLLAFSPDNDYQSWKEQIREKYTELLGLREIAKNDCDLDIEIEETKEFDEYTRIRYTFMSEKDVAVPCYLLIPKEKKQDKFPVMICLQGHSTGFHISIGEKKYDIDDRWVHTSNHAIDAVKLGFVALCIEQRGMGERTTPREDRGRALTCGCYFTAMTALLLGRTLIGERVWDVHKGIDSLSSSEDKFNLDLDDITLLGTSGGGTATYYSACFDKRIKIAVSCCAICSFRDSIAYRSHCACNYVPQIAKFMDMGELACLIAPRKLLICNADKDPIFLYDGAKEVWNVIDKIYKKEKSPDNVRFKTFENKEHYFDKEVVFKELMDIRK